MITHCLHIVQCLKFKSLIKISVSGYWRCLWNARRWPQEEVSAKAENTPNLRWKVAFMLKSKRTSCFASLERSYFKLVWIVAVFYYKEKKRGRIHAHDRFATTVSLNSEMSCHQRKVHTSRVKLMMVVASQTSPIHVYATRIRYIFCHI